jgi:hypothetical protein
VVSGLPFLSYATVEREVAASGRLMQEVGVHAASRNVRQLKLVLKEGVIVSDKRE